MLDLITGKTTFLFPGLTVEIIKAGEFKGFLIGEKDPITRNRGRITVYWLPALSRFKKSLEIR